MLNLRSITHNAAVILLVCPVFFPFTTANSDVLVYSTKEQLLGDARTAPCRSDDRLAAVIAELKSCGAPESDISVTESGHIKNIVVSLKGTDRGFVVIGAHYDKVNVGCGAVDNWSGVVLLAHVYKTFRQLRTNRSLLFVAFGNEEDGLRGSKAMVSKLTKQDRESYCAMVNLDSFGLSTPQVLENTSTAKLRDFVKIVAEKSKVPLATAMIEGADADSSSFKWAGIPAVTLHGLSADWSNIIHTTSDKPDLIKPESLYLGYVLTLRLVAELDGCECNAFR